MPKDLQLRSLLTIFKDALVQRRFSSYQGEDFSVRRVRVLGPGTVLLSYMESGRSFEFAAEEDTDGGLLLSLEEMSRFSIYFRMLGPAEKLAIAHNIIRAAASKRIPIQILDGNRPL